MNTQITDAGLAALNANTGVITLSLCKIGDGYNYIPSPTDTDIHGALKFSGVPSAPVAVNANVVKYGFYMDYSVGDFAYGEFGLFMDNGELFALGCSSTLSEKLKLNSANTGNSVRIDIYLSVNNQNYDMWFDIGESNNQFRLAVLQSPDILPQSKDATPNAYVIQGASPDQNAILAFTDRNGLWTFDAYQFINQVSGTIIGFDSQSVTIALADYTTDMTPSYFGEVIFEFTSGIDYSVCRYVSSTVQSNGVMHINFATPLLKTPALNDTFVIFKRNPLSSSNVMIPIASATVLGGVKLNNQFNITDDGVLSLNTLAIGWVQSVNGMTGDVVLTAADIEGLALVAKTGQYSDLLGTPTPYVLPTASQTTIGGVKTPTNGNLVVGTGGVIDFGFQPVKTVGGVSADANGNVNPPLNIGLVNPQLIVAGSDLNAFQTSGLFFTDGTTGAVTNSPTNQAFTLEIIPFETTGIGSVIQRVSIATNAYVRLFAGGSWTSWVAMNPGSVVATTNNPGIVQVGTGLSITGAGVLSSIFKSVNGKAFDPVSGVILLSASDVNAIDASTIGFPTGVAGRLTDANGTQTDADYYYQNARLPAKQLARGTAYAAGTWNANTNAVTNTNSDDWTVNSLTSGGNMSVTVEGPLGTFNTVNVSAEGRSYNVAVAGSTSIDGNATWSVGDVIQSSGGLWRKLYSVPVRSVSGALPTADGNITLTSSIISNSAGGVLQGRTSAGLTASLSLYATGTNPLYLNVGGGNTVYFGNGAGGTVAYVDNAGNATFTNATALSDIRDKENIEIVTGAVAKLMKLRYFTYNLIGQPNQRLLSTAAQDLQAVQPETVSEREDGKLGVYTEGHVALVGAALQEALITIKEMKEEILALRQQIEMKGN